MSILKERSVELSYFDIYPAPIFVNELLLELVLFQYSRHSINKFFSLEALLGYFSNDMFPCGNLISLREMFGRTLVNCGM